MVALSDNPLVFLLLVNIFLLLVGMFMDGIAALIILVPIFMPILPTYDVDPIHFGIIICINLTIGLLTPPLVLVYLLLHRLQMYPLVPC